MRLFHVSVLFICVTGLNPLEEYPNPSLVPHTDSDGQLVSSSRPGAFVGVTRLPDTFGFRSVSVRQGGGYAGWGDNTRFRAIPQEVTHNGQEKAVSVISDPAHTATHTHTDSRKPFTLNSPDRTLNTVQSSDLNTDTPPDPTTPNSEIPHDSKIFHLGDITVMSSAPTATGSYITAVRNHATVTEPQTSHSDTGVTDRKDTAVMSLTFTANQDRPKARPSSEMFRTNNHFNPDPPDLSITGGFLSDTVSGLKVSESNGVTYVGDGAVMSSTYTHTAGAGASRTFRFPRSTHTNKNVSNGTSSSLMDNWSSVTPEASLSYSHLEMSTVSHALEGPTTPKNTERYSYTTLNTHSTPTQSTATHTIHTKVFQQTTHPHGIDTNTHTSMPHMQLDSDTSTRQDFFSISTRSQSDPTTSSSLHTNALTALITTTPPTPAGPITAPYDTVMDTSSVHVSEEQMQNDNEVPEMDTMTSYSHHHHYVSSNSADSKVRLVTDSHHAPSSSTLSTSLLLPASSLLPSSSSSLPSSSLLPSSSSSLPSSSLLPSSSSSSTSSSSLPSSSLLPSSSSSSLLPSSSSSLPSSSSSLLLLPLSPSSPLTSPSPRNDPVSPPLTPLLRLTSPPAHTPQSTTANTPPANLYTNQTSHGQKNTPQAKIQNPEHLTASGNSQNIQHADTTTHTVHTHTLAETYTLSTPETNPTSSHRTVTTKTYTTRSHRGQVFIVEDQPAVIKVETFQLLLQVILEEESPPNARLLEVEPFLQTVAGYQRQHVTWHSGRVLQSVLMFRTVETVSWLERAEFLLQEAGLNPLPPQGFFVSGIRVKNITVGGLNSDVCSWLFFCPPQFSCVSSERNVTCKSVCHSEFCKNHGICVHRSGQNPVCQCPVGEDFWFMGQRCDLRMTRQRLAGVCFGVLATLAALMGLLSYLAVRRFKKMLLQAKTEQTQSSYRRFNHFDELSARFWRRSWPGSQDSLDHTVFSRSDELLHMRALDRPCCYHDDTLSIASTYPDSVICPNTVYPHSSQYQWDMSTCSLADGVVDSGKASDLSVCSWPIEPIQWTPFPLLQQLRNTNTMKASCPRSYCEGMELVGLEKSRTA